MNKRPKVAFVVSTPLVPLTAGLAMDVNFHLGGDFFRLTPESIFFVGMPVAYILALLIGVPIHIWLRDKHELSYLTEFATGAIISFVCMFLISIPIKWGASTGWLIVYSCVALSGGIGAMIYGFISGDIVRITNRSTTDAQKTRAR